MPRSKNAGVEAAGVMGWARRPQLERCRAGTAQGDGRACICGRGVSGGMLRVEWLKALRARNVSESLVTNSFP